MRHLFGSSARRGFTVVELMVVIVVLAGAGIALVTAVFNMYYLAINERAKVELGGDIDVAMSILDRDIRFSRGFLTTLPTGYVDTFGDGTVAYGGAGYAWDIGGIISTPKPQRALIVRANATTEHPLSLRRNLVYQGVPLSSSCANTGERILKQQHYYYMIYFVRNGNLTKRTIVDTSTDVCVSSPQYQVMSCPIEIDVNAYSVCNAHDEILARDVEEFSVQYYQTTPGAPPTPVVVDAYSMSPRPLSIPDIEGIVVKIGVKRQLGTTDATYEKEVRMTRMNQ